MFWKGRLAGNGFRLGIDDQELVASRASKAFGNVRVPPKNLAIGQFICGKRMQMKYVNFT